LEGLWRRGGYVAGVVEGGEDEEMDGLGGDTGEGSWKGGQVVSSARCSRRGGVVEMDRQSSFDMSCIWMLEPPEEVLVVGLGLESVR